MEQGKLYVMAAIFSADKKHVLLQSVQHEDHRILKLPGYDMGPFAYARDVIKSAINRDLDINILNWAQRLVIIRGNDEAFVMYAQFFKSFPKAFVPILGLPQYIWCSTAHLLQDEVAVYIPNLRWMLPLLLDDKFMKGKVYETEPVKVARQGVQNGRREGGGPHRRGSSKKQHQRR